MTTAEFQLRNITRTRKNDHHVVFSLLSITAYTTLCWHSAHLFTSKLPLVKSE